MGKARSNEAAGGAVNLLLAPTGVVVVSRDPVVLPQLVHPVHAQPASAPWEPEPTWPEETRTEHILEELDRLDIELRRSRRPHND